MIEVFIVKWTGGSGGHLEERNLRVFSTKEKAIKFKEEYQDFMYKIKKLLFEKKKKTKEESDFLRMINDRVDYSFCNCEIEKFNLE